MKVGIFDPYLDTLGGGEKYILDIALCLAKDHSVSLFWDDPSILKEAEKRFNINPSSISVVPNIFLPKTSLFKKIMETRKYDVIFYMSDGSIPALFSKKSILLFQFPTLWVNRRSPITWFKLRKINAVICNSYFVKSYIDKIFGVKSVVIFPSATIDPKNLRKENIVLTVGRFTKGKNEKKQEMLIDVFKKMCVNGLLGWRFIVAGSVLSTDKEFVQKLKKRAKGYPIEIFDNIPFGELMSFYAKAKIYWHAAGFGENLADHPEKAEHFGITTVEAMSAAAVPVVFNGGGQTEIVNDMENGFLWNKKEELIERTNLLIKVRERWKEMSQRATRRARDFNLQTFCELITILVE